MNASFHINWALDWTSQQVGLHSQRIPLSDSALCIATSEQSLPPRHDTNSSERKPKASRLKILGTNANESSTQNRTSNYTLSLQLLSIVVTASVMTYSTFRTGLKE